MFDRIIAYSIQNKLVVGVMVLVLIVWGVFSLRQIPIDAVPDITDNQIQVITVSPTLATEEVEQFITTPIELALQNIQNLVEIRSVSRFGLSVITVVFEESMDVYLARQLVDEQLKKVDIAPELGQPEMAPLSTGLGEVYQYVVKPKPGYEDRYTLTELRSIQDWIVKRQLSGIKGVVEINTFGGKLKQYEVAIDPSQLKAMGVTIVEVFDALERSNENTGGAYIEKNANAYYIRTDGLVQSIADIENIWVKTLNGRPIRISDVAEVRIGSAPRYGALVRDGAEAVGGRVMMLKGANSSAVTERVRERIEQVQLSLPEGVEVEPYLVRDKLIKTAIHTVEKNLIEGGLIVVFILVLLLGNLRAGLIVASVIPLAMLFAIAMMKVLGISANLMSLGAIDFGLIVDGAVIIVESVVHRLQVRHAGKQLTQQQLDDEVTTAAQEIRSSAAFGEIIILMVYIPILALVGIEGKMFRPMAQTVMLAIGGALILSLTYVPMMSALFLNKKVSNKRTIADRLIGALQRVYEPLLRGAMRLKTLLVVLTIAAFGVSLVAFMRMGGEFIPTLEEGDLAMQHILPPGTSLSQSIEVASVIQDHILAEFPEVIDVIANIGSAEIPTDPMRVETADYTLVMKPKSEWTSADSRQELFEAIEESLAFLPGVALEFSQPIQLRFNELMTGSKADIAIKLYGDDLDLLYQNAKEAEAIINTIDGVGTVNVEQTVGMPQLIIKYHYDRMAQYGLHAKDINRVVRSAFAGESAGLVYEGDRRFDLVVRLGENYRSDLQQVENLFIPLDGGQQVPLAQVAAVSLENAPMQISRENTNRRIVIGVNVGDTDVETLVESIQAALKAQLDLPTGYYFTYGGQFENLKAAQARLSVAVPVALGLIFILLYFTFSSFTQALLIFTAIPFSAIGGVWALYLRDMPFSISAGIGFIALFGVAVLNGIVLIGYFNQLAREGHTDIHERIYRGAMVRLRPVIMTASVASLGFLPMALSHSGGAEVQRPLATVVIGGLITATFLTLFILPILYSWWAKWRERGLSANGGNASRAALILLFPMMLGAPTLQAQTPADTLTLEEVVVRATVAHPSIQAADLQYQAAKAASELPYSLGATEFTARGEGLYRANPQRLFSVDAVQTFPHPDKLRTQNAQRAQVAQWQALSRDLTATDIRRKAKTAYYQVQEQAALVALYDTMTARYAAYRKIAAARVQAGEGSRVEVLSLESALAALALKRQQAVQQHDFQAAQLSALLGGDVPVTALETLTQVESPALALAAEPLTLQLAAQEATVARAGVAVIAAEVKPDFTASLGIQEYWESGWLSAAQVGVQVQLFQAQNKRRQQVQEVNAAAAQARYEAQQRQWKQGRLALEQQLAAQQLAIDFYAEQLATLQPELERIALLNYRAGEQSYLEIVTIIDRVTQYRSQQIQAIGAYNRAFAEWEQWLATE